MEKKTIFQIKRTYRLSLLILLAPLVFTNCDSKKANTDSAIQGTFSSIYTNVLSKNCVGCHEPQGSATINSNTSIDFSSLSTAYQTLVNGTSMGLSANINSQCNNVPLVQTNTPADSYLLATLSASYNHTNFYKTDCSPYSPNAHGATIDANELSAIVSWITNGALNN